MSEYPKPFEPAYVDIPMSKIATECFGFHTEHAVIRALDWHKKNRSDGRIIENLLSHLQKGPLTRKERYGEWGGRILSGMFNERQDGLHVKSHTDMVVDDQTLHTDTKEQWLRLFDWFSDKTKYPNKVFLIIDTPIVVLYKHKDRHKTVIPQSVPVSERVIKAVFYRSSLCKNIRANIERITNEYNMPLIDLDTVHTGAA